MAKRFATKRLPATYDYIAPDESEIRLLLEVKGGGLAHCRLLPGGVSLAVTHKSVDEIWYFLTGTGKAWRRQGSREKVVDLEAGVCLTIPQGTHFQFRNTGQEPLDFIIATMPPWPGAQEAVEVQGKWDT